MTDRTCSADGCDRPVMVKSRKLCSTHYHVPTSKGGDDVKANVQAAHLHCNISKNTGGTDQLRLIG